MTVFKTENVALETLNGVTVNANRYIEDGVLDNVIGLSDVTSDLMTIVYPDLHFVRWSNLLSPGEARQRALVFNPGGKERHFTIGLENEDDVTGLTPTEFVGYDLTDTVNFLHSDGESGVPMLSWRTPLYDELDEVTPYSRFIAYFPNNGLAFPNELEEIIGQTIAQERQPADLHRTLTAFHDIYTKYADLVVGFRN
jgi:hypothetical protein